MSDFLRKGLFGLLWRNLRSKPNFIQVVTGPRQVGKTTLALQVYQKWAGPKIYQSADTPEIPQLRWISHYWQQARELRATAKSETLLIFDEIQKIPRWSSSVKKLYDEDKRLGIKLRVVLLGSSALLMQRGLTESLAGRFELHRHPHWSFFECQQYFSLSLNEYLCFGGYPGALLLRRDWERWTRFIKDSLIETVLSKDVLLMTPITKPALLRQVFALAVAHPAEIISYQKMLGQLQEAGNTTTIASYLRLLANAYLTAALERWSGSKIKQKGSIPKIIVMDNSFISAMSGKNFKQLKKDKTFWGRMVENTVGAKLHELLQEKGSLLYYWRDRQEEVDFVFEVGGRIIAIEVKSSNNKAGNHSLLAFARRYKGAELFLIIPNKTTAQPGIKQVLLKDFFRNPKSSLAL